MVGKEIVNEVYEFIKNNPNRPNQSDIVRGLKKVCTRLPVLDAIDELTSDKDGTEEPKVKFSRNTPRGFYHYYVNDRNEYNKLMTSIENLEGLANRLTSVAIKDISIMTKVSNRDKKFLNAQSKTGILLDKQFRNLIHMAQLTIFGTITAVVMDIQNNIKSNEDRESLYLRLSDVLAASSKLNKVIIPEIMRAAWSDLKESTEKYHIVTGSLYVNIITGIMSLSGKLNLA